MSKPRCTALQGFGFSVLAAGAFALVSPAASAQPVATVTQTLLAEADTLVRTDLDGRRNDNYGRQQVLMVGTGRGGDGKPAGAADATRTLLRFDLSNLPRSPLISAELLLSVYQFNLGPANSVFTVNAHRVVPSGLRTPWVEGNGFEGWPTNAPTGSVDVDSAFGVAWAGAGDNSDPSAANNASQPDFDGVVEAGALIAQAATPRGALIRWNLTDLVKRWRSGVVPNLGLVLRDPTTGGAPRELYFDAKDGAALPVPDPNWHAAPRLLLVFQAEPASTAECKDDGWMNFPLMQFRNQGQCVSWVATRELAQKR